MVISLIGLVVFSLLNIWYKVTRTHILGILLFGWITGVGQVLCVHHALQLNGISNIYAIIVTGFAVIVIMDITENSIVNKIKES